MISRLFSPCCTLAVGVSAQVVGFPCSSLSLFCMGFLILVLVLSGMWVWFVTSLIGVSSFASLHQHLLPSVSPLGSLSWPGLWAILLLLLCFLLGFAQFIATPPHVFFFLINTLFA